MMRLLGIGLGALLIIHAFVGAGLFARYTRLDYLQTLGLQLLLLFFSLLGFIAAIIIFVADKVMT